VEHKPQHRAYLLGVKDGYMNRRLRLMQKIPDIFAYRQFAGLVINGKHSHLTARSIEQDVLLTSLQQYDSIRMQLEFALFNPAAALPGDHIHKGRKVVRVHQVGIIRSAMPALDINTVFGQFFAYFRHNEHLFDNINHYITNAYRKASKIFPKMQIIHRRIRQDKTGYSVKIDVITNKENF